MGYQRRCCTHELDIVLFTKNTKEIQTYIGLNVVEAQLGHTFITASSDASEGRWHLRVDGCCYQYAITGTHSKADTQRTRHPVKMAPITSVRDGVDVSSGAVWSPWLDPGLLRILLDPQGRSLAQRSICVVIAWIQISPWVLVHQAPINWPRYLKN